MGAGIGGSALRVHLLVDGTEWAPRVLPDSSLEWIVPVRAGARIEARRTSLDIYKQYCPYDPREACRPPQYAYDLQPVGLAGVRVEGVVPLQVLPPGEAAGDTALVAPGREATFTVQAVDGMRDTRWYFFAWEGSLRLLRDCSGQMSCTIIPPKRGAVIVYGKWNGYTFGSEYLQIKAVPAELQLTCSRYTVTRGDDLTCNATASSGVLDSVRWEFVDSAANTVRASSGSTSWFGEMVVGGRITVTAKLNGLAAADDTAIVVAPRRWPRINVVAADSGNGHLPAAPTAYGELADTHAPYPTQPFVTKRVPSGPNAGIWYLKDPIRTVTAAVHISAGFRPGSAFHQQQHSGTDPVTGNPFCAKLQVPAVERGAREHEGLVPSALTSHVEVFQRWFRANTPQNSMEAVTGRDEEFSATWSFSEKLMQEYNDEVAQPAYQDPNQKHTTDNPPGLVAFPAVPCALRF
jgi:hypothetical protein